MRILLSTYGSRGDVEPLAGLALALRALGAEALVSAPPDRECIDLLTRKGVEYARAFMSVKQWIEEASGAPLSLPQLAARMIPAQYEAIDAVADGCDAIVSTGLFPSAAAARCVAEKRGLRYEHVAFCPISLPSHHHAPIARPGRPHPPEVTDARTLWALDRENVHALFGEALNAHRADIGLAAVGDARGAVLGDRPLLASDPILWPWEETDLSQPLQTGAWVLRDDRPLSADLTAFLRNGPPPVYVGFGSISMPSVEAAARTAVEAIRAGGDRVVLARGWAGADITDRDPDCFVTGEVNQQALFRRVAAVVHHGGAGTTTTAARAGAPQVIAPQIVDQPYWAARVERVGLGVALDGPTPTFAALSRALETALAPETLARSEQLAGTLVADGAMRAARLLLEPG